MVYKQEFAFHGRRINVHFAANFMDGFVHNLFDATFEKPDRILI